MVELVLPFTSIGPADLPRVGGKGAKLGELHRAGMAVPPGFCVTTAAFAQFFTAANAQALTEALDAIDPRAADELDQVRTLGAQLRAHLEAAPIPEPVEAAIREGLAAATSADTLGPGPAWAVRSSATLEDLAEASFAGQHDTYLGVRGVEELLDRVRACWASAFTDRAITYRRQHGFRSAQVELCVVIQRMVAAEVSGVAFSADPLGGHRRVASIDATWGLGEALVSGLVEPDNYRLDRDAGALLEHRVGAKAMAITMTATGTATHDLPEARRQQRALDDAQLALLLALLDAVEAHYGEPQDIEWCFEAGALYLVQARPITTLYPIPEVFGADAPPPDVGERLYISFNHLQVMTDTIRPLGMDTLRYLFPLGKARDEDPSTVFRRAGGRLFIDLTPALLRPAMGARLLRGLTLADPKMAAIAQEVAGRGGFERPAGRTKRPIRPLLRRIVLPVLRQLVPNLLWRDPVRLRAWFEDSVEALAQQWQRELSAPGDAQARLAAIRAFLQRGLAHALRNYFPVLITGVLSWKLIQRLTGGDPRAEALSRGLEGNVTTQMDLELADLADLAREHPELRARIHDQPELLLDPGALAELSGGPGLAEAWARFIERYGHRAIGEIDITRQRWSETPDSLLASLSGMLLDTSTESPGQHRRQHELAARSAEEAAAGLLADSRGLRRRLIRHLLPRARMGLAVREHPKFLLMRGLGAAREGLVEIAAELVARGQLDAPEDLWWLEYGEIEAGLGAGVQTPPLRQRVAERRTAYAAHAHLRPPRVILSTGEVPRLQPRGDLPPNTLEGVSASLGVIEGTARVVLDPTRERLEPGEILVAPFTDPGWTPLFVHAAGLVMEVGGLMTHGSVVAREYGLPAVVGVDDCTTKIRSGQRLRLDGDQGLVTILDDPGPPTSVG
ncbi:phosphoenolpyruvate synthase [Plesiocystis pacifica SIR-1]|uniref:Phosphoenolpyruvate synthase n=1 Tax=Plesiocystis pacifica SIR-1 TaxID=391625 RepID=A6FXJ9_9BACT|nr:PEP/pyruvate-binding domain-containing protein [Plesiocystis pacifica]EDM81587.1 phosphoenolpyruvate synthase [Plesiocystis pacifica SIR-1]